MLVLSKLTFENLKQNKRRTIFTIIGVALASALMLAVVGMVTSVQQTMVDATVASTGNYHEIYEDVPEEGRQYLEHNANVDSFYYAGQLEYLDESSEEFYQRNQHIAYSKLYVTFNGDEDETRIFVRYKNVRKAEATREQILDVIEDETGTRPKYRTNRQLIQYEGGVSGEAMREIATVAAIVVVIIVATSVLAIRNSFSISATERMRQFGMLGSVGATKRQIRQSVMLEAVMVWIVAVPAGILLGLVATAILVVVVTALIGDELSIPMAFSVPWWIFPVIAALSLITVSLSALFPAIRAAKMPPVEAIRGNREIKIKPRRIRTSPLTRKVFGVGGVIASKNLKRARSKYRTTVISIVVSVATFIGLSTFIQQAFGTTRMFYQQVDYDLMVAAENTAVFEEIKQKFNLDQMVYYSNVAAYSQDSNLEILMVSQAYFEAFAKTVGIKGEVGDAAILYDYVFADNGTKRVLQHTMDTQAGNDLTILMHKDHQEKTLQVAAVVEKAPLGYELASIPVLLISENTAKKLGLDLTTSQDESPHYLMFAATNDVDGVIQFIEEQEQTNERYTSVIAQNIRESMKMMNNLYLLVAIFLYGFIAVITLIGVTNVFNTISANMALRASEFASLKSIGMTSQEFNRMIRLESLMYATKALAIGVPLGLLISWGFYTAMSSSYDFGYDLPIVAILIAVLAVAALIWAVMRYSVSLVNKQNIIETIRSDTV